MPGDLDFRAAMEAAGLRPPAVLIADGLIHRCKRLDKNKLDGAYKLFPSYSYGGFENWSDGRGWQKWGNGHHNTEKMDRAAYIAAVRADEEKRNRASLKAAMMWEGATEGSHPYLCRKGICSNGSRVLGDSLLIPMRSIEGKLRSLQMIHSDGSKLFLTGGRTKGCFHVLLRTKSQDDAIYICEGFATGSTIHAATGGACVVIAFSCGNLGPVCKAIREKRPTTRIIVCADNDRLTEGNPGLAHARAAAAAIHARLCIPDFTGEGTDFNDMAAIHGISAVKKQLNCSIKARD